MSVDLEQPRTDAQVIKRQHERRIDGRIAMEELV